ncbi:hypothetical protein NX722_01420 [Endozoicomonas gorgoniicola]|uniref:Uncharacterized protein n=1 Tax=Endozoicomonas gorgoniicola TaxID=1234144 RepID=A0ABT3MPL4_9GAMM|nr:hypothetical protein [Endozoicomonas gorgoniicola]MCW7551320.1 hypothetical protein [Endozoicomonas gorgoniicola]
MNPSAIAGSVKQVLNTHGRTAAISLAAAFGQSAGVQYGPKVVNCFINWTVKGTVAKFFLRNAAHAAIGGGYPWLGQVALTGAVYVCPGPGKIAATWSGYKFNRDYQNQLKTFNPEALKVRSAEDDWLLCDDLQEKPSAVEEEPDVNTFDWVEDDAKDIATPATMGTPEAFEMDDLASGESAEGFEFVSRLD